MATRIAVVDDDRVSRETVAEYLCDKGFEAVALDGGAALRELMRSHPPDMVLLDVLMPHEDGLSVLRWLRSLSELPVIMLTGADGSADRVAGLELGADDYVAKPPDLRELLARVRANLRRHRASPPPNTEQAARGSWFGRWRLDRVRRMLVDSSGETLELGAAEYTLLAVFADHPGVVLSRDKLMELTGTDPREVFDRAIDLRIARLRKKIEPVAGNALVIRTVRGHGGGYEYVFSAEPQYGR